jgi:hypothetical protein
MDSNYKKTGPWYDWAYVKFSHADDDEGAGLYPCQIWYFIDLQDPIFCNTLQALAGSVDYG